MFFSTAIQLKGVNSHSDEIQAIPMVIQSFHYIDSPSSAVAYHQRKSDGAGNVTSVQVEYNPDNIFEGFGISDTCNLTIKYGTDEMFQVFITQVTSHKHFV